MSTSSSAASGATSPSTTDQIQIMLRRHIQRAAVLLRIQDLATLVILWLAALIGTWLLASLIEHWLVPFSSVARWLVWLVLVGGSAWLAVRWIAPLLWRRINPDYVAQRIEQAEPELKSGLVSWLQLESLPDNGVPRGIMAGLARHAARYIHAEDPSSSLDTRSLIKAVATMMLLLASLAVYGMFSPKSVWDTGKRVLMPWSSIAAPARVQLISLEPGSSELTQGKPLKLDVKLRGLRAGESVTIRYSTKDGQLVDQTKDLDAAQEGFHYVGSLSTAQASGISGRGVQHELEYWVEAGDLRSGPYQITLSRTPSLNLESVVVEFPKYTKLPKRTLASGEIEAVEGSIAILTAASNQKLERGQLEIDPELDGNGELLRASASLPMEANDQKLTGKWLLKVNSARDNPTIARYRLRGFNARGDANEDPIEFRAKILPDVAPEISIPGPEDRRMRMLPDGQMNIEVRAIDPDFGLQSIAIQVTRKDSLLKRALVLQSDGVLGRQVKLWRFKATDFKAAVGDRFVITATATDNRHDPVSGEPAANQTTSDPLTIEIVEPSKMAQTDPAHQPPTDLAEPDPELQPDNQPGADQSDPSEPNDASSTENGSSSDQKDQAGDKPGDRNRSGKQGGSSSNDQQSNAQSSDKDQGDNANGQPDASPNDQSQQGQSGQDQSGQDQSGQDQSSSGQSDAASTGGASGGGGKKGEQSQKNQSQGGSGQGQSSGQGDSSQSKSDQRQNNSGQGPANGHKSGQNQSSGSGRGNSRNSQGNQSSSQPNSTGGGSSKTGSSRDQASQGKAGQNAAGQSSDDNSESSSRDSDNNPRNQGTDSAPSKPKHDGDVIERVKEFVEKQKSQPGDQQSGNQPSGNQQSGNQSESNSKPNQGGQAGKTGVQPDKRSSDKRSSEAQQPGAQPNADQAQPDQQPSGNQQQGNQTKGSQQPAGKEKDGQQQAGKEQGGQQQAGNNQSGKEQGGQQQAGKEQGGAQQGGKEPGGQQQGGQQQGGQQQGGQQQGGQQQGGQQQGGKEQGSQQGGQQPGNKEQGGQQQGGQQQGGQQQGGQQQGGQQQGGQQQGGQQQGGQQQGGQQQGGQQQGGQQQGGQQPAGKEKGGQEQGGQEQGGQEQGGQQQGGQQQGGQQQGGQQQGGQQQGGQQQGGQQQGGQQQGGQQQGGQQQGGQQQGGQQQGGQQQGGQQQGGQQQGGQQQGGQQQGGQQQGGQQQGGQQQGGQQQGGQQQGGQEQGGGQSGQGAGKGSGQSEPSTNGQAGGGAGQGGAPSGGTSAGAQQPKEIDPNAVPDGQAAANQEYANKVTNLVLDYLNEQKDQPDPELLRELNWTKQDLDAFLKRWQAARNLATSPDPEMQRKWNDELRALGLVPPNQKGQAAAGRDDKLKGLRDSGSRMRAPDALRRQYEAFRRAVQESEK